MNAIKGKLLITGGAGTLGKAIIKRATQEKWDCDITVFSTDAAKHATVRSLYPQVRCVVGDIRDRVTLYNVMAGHDVVIHAAAVKRIPESEKNSIDTFEINVTGSMNVAHAAVTLEIPHVLAISTDKACHAANAYGATKYLMEKAFQEFSRYPFKTQFHLVRYGNVLESSGSVIEAWKKAAEKGEPLTITEPEMTRFWLSPSQAVDLVLKSLELESGHIYVAKMPALSIINLLKYTIGNEHRNILGIPARAGEKMHETLLTLEELDFAIERDDHFELRPTTTPRNGFYAPWKGSKTPASPYTSDTAPELTKEQLEALLND